MLLQTTRSHPFFIYEFYFSVFMDYFFIHSSTSNGCLSHFCILATVNNAAMNIGTHLKKLLCSFSLDKYPAVELLGHMVALFLIF